MKFLISVTFLLLFQNSSFAKFCGLEVEQEYLPKYSKGFRVLKFTKKVNAFLLEVDNFDNSKRYYVLSDENLKNCDDKYQYFKMPIQKYSSLSTTHIPLFEMMDVLSLMVSFRGKKYIYNSNLRELDKKQNIKELGFPLNVEVLMNSSPDVIFGYWYSSKRIEGVLELENLNLPIVYIQEHKEKHPLARAEWMVFISYFFKKQSYMKSKFNEISKNYELIRKKVQKFKVSPKVLVASPRSSSWSAPGGQSDFAQLIRDARGRYFLDKNKSTGTQAISFEKIVEESITTNFWLLNSAHNSLKELMRDDKRISNFQSLNSIPIYNFNAKLNKYGGNDFWESSLMRPDLLLLDLCKILHPKEFLQEKHIWYKKIK